MTGLCLIQVAYNPRPRTMPEVNTSAASFERELVQAAQRGDELAITQLYERYFDRIYRYTVIKTGDPHESEDITQEVFLRAFRDIKKFEWKGAPFSSWLYRIAHNQIVDRARQQKRHPSAALGDDLTGSHWRDNPQSAVEIRSELEQLVTAVKQLTPAQREVLALRFTSELPLSHVAIVMGKTVGSVKSLQHSTIVKLRKKLLG